MKAVELTKNEREVLVAIVANAKHYGEDNNFVLGEIEIYRSSASLKGTTSSLQKKGMIQMHNENGYYFSGQVTEAGLHEVESSKVNNEQEVKQSNNSKNMAKKENLYGKGKSILAAGITMGEKTEENKPAVDNFDAPVMDERILKLNEYKAVKMANLSKGKRPAAKEAKELATYILNNWDNLAELKNIKSEDVKNEDLQNILASRLKNFSDAEAEILKNSPEMKKMVKMANDAKKKQEAKIEKKETKKAVPAKAPKADSKKAEPKAKEEVKKETKPAKTARKVGDVHPNHPTWVWTEYAEGKFDWRTNPADKKQGQRTDKATTSAKKSEPKKKAAKKETKPVKEEKKELTIDEFVALPKTTKSNKKPSEAQAKSLKLINKGYRITADKTFFEKDDSREACNWDSVVALFRRYGIKYIPEGLVKSL